MVAILVMRQEMDNQGVGYRIGEKEKRKMLQDTGQEKKMVEVPR